MSSLDSRITFTRASSAYRVNASGLLESVATNIPRFDHDMATLAPRGLLIEDARTNECLYASDLTNAAWTKANTTAALTQTGPTGAANSATLLTATAANGTAKQAITSASNTARRFSIYVKRVTGSGGVDLTMDDGTAWTAVTVTSAWTRVAMGQTLANPTVGIRIQTNTDAVAVAFCQEEAGAFDTSAILTTSATVERAGEICSMTLVDWFNRSEGTMFVEFTPIFTAAVGGTMASFSDGSSNNRIDFNRQAAGTYRLIGQIGGSTFARFDTGAVADGGQHRMCGAWISGDSGSAFNGAAMTANLINTTFAALTAWDRLLIAPANAAGGSSFAWMRRLAYWPRRLPDNVLQAMTR